MRRYVGFQRMYGLVSTAADHLVGREAEPALHLVDPRVELAGDVALEAAEGLAAALALGMCQSLPRLRRRPCGRLLDSHWVCRSPGYRCRHGHTGAHGSSPNRPKDIYVRQELTARDISVSSLTRAKDLLDFTL
jgi:hypothetical protein